MTDTGQDTGQGGELQLGPIGNAVIFENDTVRVWIVDLELGTKQAMHKHDLPYLVIPLTDGKNVMPPLIVLFTSRIGTVILVESGLSFLGFGVPPPAPTWGGMLSGSGRAYMYQGPWLALAPGLCLTIVVYSIAMFGDALRDLLDPRMRGSR